MKKTFATLLAAMLVLSAAACGNTKTAATEATTASTEAVTEASTGASSEEVTEASSDEATSEETTSEEAISDEETTLSEPVLEEIGEGEKTFTLDVVDGEGNFTKFTVHTNETTVGAALLALDLIAGEDSEYGLYVKTVNGVTADYDVDQTYWAFYENGEYALNGVDATEIVDGATYGFTVSK